jgi:hypothetical protein
MLRMLKQEDNMVEASLDYKERTCLNQKKEKKRKRKRNKGKKNMMTGNGGTCL